MNADKDDSITEIHSTAMQLISSPLSSVIQRAPESCPPRTPIRDVLERMRDLRIGSMLVTGEDNAPIGIFTLQDVLTRVALAGRSLELPVSSVMTANVATLPLSASAYEAALLMVQHGIHHVVVVEHGRLAGVVSERDLFSRLGTGLRQVSNDIRTANSLESFERCGAGIRLLARGMLNQDVGSGQITQLISTLNDLLTRRIIQLEIARAQLGEVSFCWIAMGSEGRCEQTFSSDQDNGIIFPSPSKFTADSVRELLLPVAQRINQTLSKCGFPLCRGGIMAGNPKNCLSLAEWQERFAGWVDNGDPEALLNATIFFDFRPLYGDTALSVELRTWLAAYASDNNRFLLQMTQNALENQPPLGLVRDFMLTSGGEHPHTLDLKVNGITPFVDAARVLALCAGTAATNTPERLRAAGQRLGISDADIGAWIEAFLFIQSLRLRHQEALLRRDQVAHNQLDPDTVNELERRILKEAMRQARNLQSRLARQYSVASAGYGV